VRAHGLLAVLLLLTTPGAAPLAGVPTAPADGAPVGAGDARGHKTAQDSFLFSSAALRLLEAARAGQAPAAAVAVVRPSPAPAAGSLHLGAIVYHAPDDWRVWLNGQSFTPAARPGPIAIVEVTADRVVLVWRPAGGHPTRIELRPNQTYVVASGEVVEGHLEARP
jgi:hypothetical protein